MRATRCNLLAFAADGCRIAALGALLWAAGCGSTGLPEGRPGSSREGQTADGGLIPGSAGAPVLPVAGTGVVRPTMPPTTVPPPRGGSGGAPTMPPPSRDAGVPRDGGAAADSGMPRGLPADAGMPDAMPPRACANGEHLGDLNVIGQAQLEELRGCKHVAGMLLLAGDIVDLSPLSELSQVDGDFILGGAVDFAPPNGGLPVKSLKGLEALRSVRGLFLQSLSDVTTLEPLSGLEIAGSVGVFGLDLLTNLNGLGRVTWQYLTVRDSPQITSLEGLHVPAEVAMVELRRNRSLASISALRPLQKLDTIDFEELPALKNLDGLQSLKPGYQGLSIQLCNALTDLTGLSAFPATLTIHGNAELRSLAGVASPSTNLGWVTIQENPKLENLVGVAPPHKMLTALTLDGLPSLKSLADLKTLTAIDELVIGRCDGLSDLTGLDALTNLYQITIANCAGLQNLRGLGALQQVTGILSVMSNVALTSLSGLEKLSMVTELHLTDNVSLPNLVGLTTLQSAEVVRVSSNPTFKNFSGTALRTVGELWLDSNSAFADFTGLEMLTTVRGALIVNSNPSLTSLHALTSLTMAGGLSFQLNQRLPQCEIDWLAKRTMTVAQSSENGGPTGTCPP